MGPSAIFLVVLARTGAFRCHSRAMPEPIPPKCTPNITHSANLIHTWTHARPLPGIEPDTSRLSGGEEQQTYDTTLKCMHAMVNLNQL